MTRDVVDMWFDVRGEGQPLVMLHPAGTDSRALGPLVSELADRYRVLAPDRRGHGRTPDAPGPFSFELMAEDTIAFLEAQAGEPVHLLGYSDGAIVALHVTLRRPDLVRDLVFAAAVFHRDGWDAGVLDDDDQPPQFMADAYAEVSPDGREHFAVVVKKVAAMHETAPAFTPADLGAVACPTLVLLGDDDQVRLEHAIAMFRALPSGELAVVPHASHGVLVEKPELCARLIADFHASEKPATFAPRRRAAGPR